MENLGRAELQGQCAQSASISRWRIGEIEIDAGGCCIIHSGGEPVRLEKRAMDVLAYLIAHQGRTVGKDELLASVWKKSAISENAVAIAISQVRKALGDNSEKRIVETVPKAGYRLAADVSPCAVEMKAASKVNSFVAGKYWVAGAAMAAAAIAAALFLFMFPNMESRSIVLIPAVENATGDPAFDGVSAHVGEQLSNIRPADAGWQLYRWQSGLSDPFLWEEIGKLSQKARVFILVGKVILNDEETAISLTLFDGPEGALIDQKTINLADDQVSDSLSETTQHWVVDSLYGRL